MLRLEKGDQYRVDAPLVHWPTRIAHHVIVDRARKAAREILVEDAEADWRDDEFSVDAPPPSGLPRRSSWETPSLACRTSIAPPSCCATSSACAAEIAFVHDVGLPAAEQRIRRRARGPSDGDTDEVIPREVGERIRGRLTAR